MDTDDRLEVLAAELARMPGAPQRMLATHTDDGTGRCAVCSTGRQAGRYIWPCQLHLLAARAVEIRDGGRTHRDS